MRVDIVERFPLHVRNRRLLPRRERVKNPRLLVPLIFVLHEIVRQPCGGAIDRVGAYVESAVTRDRESPHDVRGHPRIAGTLFPPAPAAVAVLRVVQPRHRRRRDRVDAREWPLRIRVRLRRGVGFDTAEEFPFDVLRLQSVLRQRARDDRGRQETAHRLLRAAVRIFEQVWQRIEHRDGETRRELHGQSRVAALVRQFEIDDRVVAAHFAGARDQLVDAVRVNRERLLHRIAALRVRRAHAQLRVSGVLRDDLPFRARVAVRRHIDGVVFRASLQRESFHFDRGIHAHRRIGVVVDDGGNRRAIAFDEKARRFKSHQQRHRRARRRAAHAECRAGRRRTCRRAPRRQRFRIRERDARGSVAAGDDVRLPQRGRAEVGTNDDVDPLTLRLLVLHRVHRDDGRCRRDADAFAHIAAHLCHLRNWRCRRRRLRSIQVHPAH